jgi:hypothetical protein
LEDWRTPLGYFYSNFPNSLVQVLQLCTSSLDLLEQLFVVPLQKIQPDAEIGEG